MRHSPDGHAFAGVAGLVQISAGGGARRPRVTFGLAPGLDAAAIRAVAAGIVTRLATKWHVDLFDPQYPSMSDPGGYVTLLRVGEALHVMVANHGWSSGWAAVSVAEAGEYVALCLADDTGAPGSPGAHGVIACLALSDGPCRWPGEGYSADRLRAYISARLAAAS